MPGHPVSKEFIKSQCSLLYLYYTGTFLDFKENFLNILD